MRWQDAVAATAARATEYDTAFLRHSQADQPYETAGDEAQAGQDDGEERGRQTAISLGFALA